MSLIHAQWNNLSSDISFGSFVVLYIIPLWFFFRGKSWARWFVAILTFAGVCYSPFLWARDHQTFSAVETVWFWLSDLLDIITVIALFHPSSNRWFRPKLAQGYKFMKTTKSFIVVLFSLLTAQAALAWYDPSAQRWLSRDPVGEPGFEALRTATATPKIATPFIASPSRWINRDPIMSLQGNDPIKRGLTIEEEPYVFVQNNPSSEVDPFGLDVNHPPPCAPYPACDYPPPSPNSGNCCSKSQCMHDAMEWAAKKGFPTGIAACISGCVIFGPGYPECVTGCQLAVLGGGTVGTGINMLRCLSCKNP